jgi:hypothetical protein
MMNGINELEQVIAKFNARDQEQTSARLWTKAGIRVYLSSGRTDFGYITMADGKVDDAKLKMGGNSRGLMRDLLNEANIPNNL